MAVLGNVGTHFPCPNHCGESYRQEDTENHRKICRLEEIACEFGDVGCKQRFNREKKEEHVQGNTQQHLSLATSQAIGTQQQLQHYQVQLKEMKENLEEDNQKQNSSLKEVEEKILEDIRDLRNIVQQQQQTLIGQDVKLKSQEQRLKKLKFERKVFAFFGFITVLLLAFLIYFAMDLKEEGTQKLVKLQNEYEELQNKYEELQNKYGELQNKYEELQNRYRNLSSIVEEIKTERRLIIQQLRALTNFVQGHAVKIEKTFIIEDFSRKQLINYYWISPDMYTHVCGYKFFLGIYCAGRDQRKDVEVELVVGPGEFDDLLSWPAKANFSLEVSYSQGGTKTFRYNKLKWNKPKDLQPVRFLKTTYHGGSKVFFYHSKVQYFLLNDTLNFRVHVEV